MKRFIGTVCLLLPLMSWSHPGHGSTAGSSLVHYLSEPLHLAGGLFILILLLFVFQRTYRKIRSDQNNY